MKRKNRRKKTGKKYTGIVRFLSVVLTLVLLMDTFAVGKWYLQKKRRDAEEAAVVQNTDKTKEPQKKEPEAEPEPEEEKKVTLMAVGDNLIHTAVWQAGVQEDGSHDYTTLYEHLSGYLQNTDIRVINQETIFAGDDKGLQDFPMFNSPEAIGHTVAQMGFNVILHASNHSMDMGQNGIIHCAKFWREQHPEVTMVGIHEDPEEESEIPVIEVKGIRLALLNYTYSHNSEEFSTYADGYLNMLCNYDEGSRRIDFNTIHPKVLEDIKKAEKMADFTIVFPHWGTEYTMKATDQEVRFAKQMTEAGADLIIGTHPHVVQPVEWVSADNGNRALCYYSLGNFTSAQNGIPQMLGGLANLTIVKNESGTFVEEESIKAIPLVTHFVYPGWTGSTVVESTYLLKDYTDEQAAKHGLKRAWGITMTRQDLMTLAENTFGKYLSME